MVKKIVWRILFANGFFVTVVIDDDGFITALGYSCIVLFVFTTLGCLYIFSMGGVGCESIYLKIVARSTRVLCEGSLAFSDS